MIFDSNDEKNAFEYICELAGQSTDRICTDLNPRELELFKHLKVPTDDGEKTIMENISQSYSVVYWLGERAKRPCDIMPINKNYPTAICTECGKVTDIQFSHNFRELVSKLKTKHELLNESRISQTRWLNVKNGQIQAMHKTIAKLLQLLTPEQKEKAKIISQEMRDNIKKAEKDDIISKRLSIYEDGFKECQKISIKIIKESSINGKLDVDDSEKYLIEKIEGLL